MSNIQTWSGFSVDEAKEEEKLLAEMGKGKFHKLVDGKNRLRFLPAKIGQKTFIKTHQHFVKVGDQEGVLAFNCPRRMANQPCVVCTDAEYLGATGSSTDYELAGKLFAQFRVFANVIDREHPEAGPVTFAFGKKIYEALVKLRADEQDGGDFTDPEGGFDIIIVKSGTGLQTKYETRASLKGSTPLGDMTWIDVQPDISRYVRVPTPEELDAAIQTSGYKSASRRAAGGAQVVSPRGGRSPAKNVASSLGDDD